MTDPHIIQQMLPHCRGNDFLCFRDATSRASPFCHNNDKARVANKANISSNHVFFPFWWTFTMFTLHQDGDEAVVNSPPPGAKGYLRVTHTTWSATASCWSMWSLYDSRRGSTFNGFMNEQRSKVSLSLRFIPKRSTIVGSRARCYDIIAVFY